MINQVIVKYFKEGINNNNSVNSLKSALLKAGWNKIDIEDSANVALVNKEKRLPIAPSASAPVSSASLGRKERPIGVSILAVLAWINAGMLVLFALFALFFFSVLSSFIGGFGGGLFIFSMIGFILFGLMALLGFFFGRGLWRGKNGWRIFYLVILGLSTVLVIINLFAPEGSGFFNLILIGFLIWYMGFKKNVVEFFKKN